MRQRVNSRLRPLGLGRTPRSYCSASSIVPEQRNVDTLQRALDALGPFLLPVVATTGGIVDPADLTAPANAYLVPFADHDTLIARVSLMVGHGGHGTTMQTLRHGRPMVGIPQGADQIPTTKLD